MGEAKKRGTMEQRQAQAVAAARAKFPASVACNACGVDLTEIQPLDTRGLHGMRVAGAALCGCGNVTYILDGTPEALATMREILDQEHGGGAKLGFAEKPR